LSPSHKTEESPTSRVFFVAVWRHARSVLHQRHAPAGSRGLGMFFLGARARAPAGESGRWRTGRHGGPGRRPSFAGPVARPAQAPRQVLRAPRGLSGRGPPRRTRLRAKQKCRLAVSAWRPQPAPPPRRPRARLVRRGRRRRRRDKLGAQAGLDGPSRPARADLAEAGRAGERVVTSPDGGTRRWLAQCAAAASEGPLGDPVGGERRLSPIGRSVPDGRANRGCARP
jgi:hypothetical protein